MVKAENQGSPLDFSALVIPSCLILPAPPSHQPALGWDPAGSALLPPRHLRVSPSHHVALVKDGPRGSRSLPAAGSQNKRRGAWGWGLCGRGQVFLSSREGGPWAVRRTSRADGRQQDKTKHPPSTPPASAHPDREQPCQ